MLYSYPVDLPTKLAILADAAKYDASCASSGGTRRDSSQGRGLGSNEGMGICHSFAPDGRCISLLKILLTNFCLYDCAYCINRRGSDVPRARFTVEEVVALTLDFYRRNCIEGLFLSSGVIRDPSCWRRPGAGPIGCRSTSSCPRSRGWTAWRPKRAVPASGAAWPG